MISIIIIALNEEKNLPKLLKSIKRQDFKDYEIIVSDAGSKDKTVKIAKRNGCRVVKGGLPSIGRNNGAKAAKGNMLLFLDADVILPDNFLEEIVQDFNKKNLDVAGVYMKPISKNVVDKIYYSCLNSWFFIIQKIYPHVVGSCMISTRKVQKKIKGFNPEIDLSEDNDYVNRASKHFKFGMVNNSVFVSARRFQKEGRFKMGIKYLLILLHRIFLGEIKKKNRFDYKFGHYDDK